MHPAPSPMRGRRIPGLDLAATAPAKSGRLQKRWWIRRRKGAVSLNSAAAIPPPNRIARVASSITTVAATAHAMARPSGLPGSFPIVLALGRDQAR